MLNILCREESGTRARRERWPRLALCAVLLFCTVLALGVWIVNGDDLYDDETQYWDWSRRLDLGYYSKPPMIAYVIAAATAIGGDREFALRLTGLTFKLANIALLYLLTWRISGKERAAGLAALLFLAWNAMAKFAGLSASLTTNEVLLFFWLLSIFLFHHAIHGRPGIYPLCGIALGCANLSRFTALLLLLGFLLFTALKRREEFKRLLFYTVPLIGAGALAGVLFWNWQHDWVTWRHTAGLGLEKAVSTPAGWRTFSKYLIVQGLSANPVLYLYYIWLVWALFKRSKYNEDAALLLACALPLYLIYAAAAFTREVSGHWPQAAYPACIAGLAWLWSESKLSSPRFAPLWIAIAVAPFIVLYAAVTAPPHQFRPRTARPFQCPFPARDSSKYLCLFRYPLPVRAGGLLSSRTAAYALHASRLPEIFPIRSVGGLGCHKGTRCHIRNGFQRLFRTGSYRPVDRQRKFYRGTLSGNTLLQLPFCRRSGPHQPCVVQIVSRPAGNPSERNLLRRGPPGLPAATWRPIRRPACKI